MKFFCISATNPVGCVLFNGVNGWDEDDMIVRRIIRNGRKNQDKRFFLLRNSIDKVSNALKI
jgi:hypothetical protein